MEKKSDSQFVSDGEFLELLLAVKQNDADAMLRLLRIFKKDISHLAKFIRLPKEDAEQSIITELIELLKNGDLRS